MIMFQINHLNLKFLWLYIRQRLFVRLIVVVEIWPYLKETKIKNVQKWVSNKNLTGTALLRAASAFAMFAEFVEEMSGDEELEELVDDVVVVIRRAGSPPPEETVTNLLIKLVELPDADT